MKRLIVKRKRITLKTYHNQIFASSHKAINIQNFQVTHQTKKIIEAKQNKILPGTYEMIVCPVIKNRISCF